MAITAGSQAGRAPYQVNGAEATAPVAMGASAVATTPTASTTVTLPKDANSIAYSCYRFTASGNIWFGFGSGPATAGGANEWLITPGMIMDVWALTGSTQFSAIFDAASTTGSLCCTGIY